MMGQVLQNNISPNSNEAIQVKNVVLQDPICI